MISCSVLLLAASAPAITLSSGPTFTPATNAPLAGSLVFSTDVPTRLAVSVTNPQGSWTRSFPGYSVSHSLVLAGFKPATTNLISVILYDASQNSYNYPTPVVFTTPALPADFPHGTMVSSDPARMEPGYTLFVIQNRTAKTAYLTMLDSSGEVIWYSPAPAVADVDVRQLPNGDLFLQEPTPLNQFREIDLLGQTVHTWTAPAQYPVDNHEGLVTDHGTILYLSNVGVTVTNFPSNTTNSQAPRVTATIDDNPIVEISVTNGALLHAWSPITMLDPTRVTYLTYSYKSSYGVDNEHANAIIEDPSDNSIIVSLRTQNAVFKFLRSTGQVKWILGSHTNWSAPFQQYLLQPQGSPFAWSYGQHAPELTPNHTLLVYDDGNFRADPFDPPVPDQANYSRAVEYSIDETSMTVSQVWDSSQAPGDHLYTFAVGDADSLPKTQNILATHGLVSYVNGASPSAANTNATMVRIREYTHAAIPEVVFDVSFFDPSNTASSYLGYLCYRSDRIPDFYAHPVLPVPDLALSTLSDGALLQFSGDPFRSYTVEASADLSKWQTIGSPVVTASGTCQFQDTTPGATARFYRIATH